MNFRPGDIVRTIDTRRLGKVVGVMPSGRIDVYMMGVGSFIPYSKPELWELAERPPAEKAPDTVLNGGQVIMDTDLIHVIRRQAERIGNQANALGQIKWMGQNYVVRNHKATEVDLRRVLMDIVQTVVNASTSGDLTFTLRGSYEDTHGNPFPPAFTASGDNETQKED